MSENELVTFTEISPSELSLKYERGMSMAEIANSIDRSYTYVRNSLLDAGVTFRSKEAGTRLYITRHPEWARQFVSYKVDRTGEISDDKIRLVTMIIAEGYVDRTSLGFTNVQDLLHDRFRRLVETVYRGAHLSQSGILSRISSVEISKDIGFMMDGKAFSSPVFQHLLASRELIIAVLKIIADTKGSMIVSVRKAPNNFTVECRVVLANTDRKFREQIVALLATLQIHARVSEDGVFISRKDHIKSFIQLVGFSPGVRVIRKKAGTSTWFGREKDKVSKVCLRLYGEQEKAKKSMPQGCFASCKTKEHALRKLMNWYGEIEGGDRKRW